MLSSILHWKKNIRMKLYVMLFLWMLVTYYLVGAGSMIEKLFIMVSKTPILLSKMELK